ncbi:hypothetical protein H7F51_07995 [Novosphingobium flavum]|uniref:Alpha/beta hydrolase n=1 Tax=Novosphingobium flavum TaxID=1778672 RepID=A0A7X1KLQ3_9SPHN|nr:hypothetical protein [Novosphingobium flavum]MBC2665460.1 hypothetical protein [Novosphingobium flavum]
MKRASRVFALAAGLIAATAFAQVAPPVPPAPDAPRERPRKPIDPLETAAYRSSPVTLPGGLGTALLYEPKGQARTGVVLVSFDHLAFNRIAAELATRGYRVLYVHSPEAPAGHFSSAFLGFPQLSAAIHAARALPQAGKVVLTGWGGGATSTTLYANVAANGVAACQRATLIYRCTAAEAKGLAAPDGLILFDPGPGAASRTSNIDPTYAPDGKRSHMDLDVFSPANGFDVAKGAGTYSPAFRKRYFAAQSARYQTIVSKSAARLRELERATGAGADEPFTFMGADIQGGALSLHYADLSILSRSKRPHLLLKADGTRETTVLRSIRGPAAPVGEDALRRVDARRAAPSPSNSTLRSYLANDAIRVSANFALTADDITGVDWSSSLSTPIGQAEGVRVPSLVMTNTCFQFVVPGELVFDHLGARDKEQVGVEGSEHFLNSCGPQFGDTKARLFDYVANWLAKPGRFN